MASQHAVNILGYTRSGKPVAAPSRSAPNTNDIVVFHRTKAKFADWTKADHMDASDILARSDAPHATRWSSVHWDIGGRWTSPEFDAYIGSRP